MPVKRLLNPFTQLFTSNFKVHIFNLLVDICFNINILVFNYNIGNQFQPRNSSDFHFPFLIHPVCNKSPSLFHSIIIRIISFISVSRLNYLVKTQIKILNPTTSPEYTLQLQETHSGYMEPKAQWVQLALLFKDLPCQYYLTKWHTSCIIVPVNMQSFKVSSRSRQQ